MAGPGESCKSFLAWNSGLHPKEYKADVLMSDG
jgi:hypothetical protein